MRNIFFQAASVAASVTVATTVSVVMVPEAHAASITRTIGGVSYDITEVQGSIFDLLPTLERQVWWGNDSLAREFAVAAGANWGPAPFAFDYGSVQVFFW